MRGGVVVSICNVPAGLVTAPERSAALPAPSVIVAALALTALIARSDGVLAGTDRIAEGQRIGAGAAGIGGRAAVIERQRRCAARDRHRFAQIQRQSGDIAGIEVAAPAVIHAPTPPPTRPSASWYRSAACRSGLVTAPERLAALPAPSVMVAALALTAVTARSACSGPPNRIAEGQRIGAGAAGISRHTAVIEGERRRAAGDRHRLGKVECQGYCAAGIKIASSGIDPRSRCHHRRDCWRRGIDLRAALGQADKRQVGGIAGAIGDGRGIEIDCRRHQVRRILTRRNRIAEGQRIAAGTAGIGRHTAIVKRQRRRAAGDRHRLAHAERQRHDLAGIEIAVHGGVSDIPDHCRRDGVHLQRAGGAGHSAGEIGGIAGAIGDGRGIGIDRGDGKIRRVLASTDRIAEGQRTGAGAAAIGRRTAVVERQRRRAAGDRHRFAHLERQCHDLAGIEIAVATGDAGARRHHRRYRRRRGIDLQRAGWDWSRHRRDWRHCRRHR